MELSVQTVFQTSMSFRRDLVERPFAVRAVITPEEKILVIVLLFSIKLVRTRDAITATKNI